MILSLVFIAHVFSREPFIATWSSAWKCVLAGMLEGSLMTVERARVGRCKVTTRFVATMNGPGTASVRATSAMKTASTRDTCSTTETATTALTASTTAMATTVTATIATITAALLLNLLLWEGVLWQVLGPGMTCSEIRTGRRDATIAKCIREIMIGGKEWIVRLILFVGIASDRWGHAKVVYLMAPKGMKMGRRRRIKPVCWMAPGGKLKGRTLSEMVIRVRGRLRLLRITTARCIISHTLPSATTVRATTVRVIWGL